MNGAGDPATVSALLRQAARELSAQGDAEAAADARLLLAESLGEPRLSVALHGERVVAGAQLAHFASLLARRLAGEPVGRILGVREFWGLPFRLSPDTLEPRQDSETLIEAALEALGERRNGPLTILDLGTGSGCLLIALMSECPQAAGIGVDLAQGALRTARMNAQAAGFEGRCRWLVSDWGEALALKADVILSNPPYIATDEIAGLSREVSRHDPARALDGGKDGLDAYRSLALALPRLLQADGVAVVELGLGQRAAVSALMAAAGLAVIGCRQDLGGIDRALVLKLPGAGAHD